MINCPREHLQFAALPTDAAGLSSKLLTYKVLKEPTPVKHLDLLDSSEIWLGTLLFWLLNFHKNPKDKNPIFSLYSTQGGVNKQPRSNVVTCNPLMWIKALDLIMDKLKITGCDLYSVKAISGSAQQHGTVYWVSRQLIIDCKKAEHSTDLFCLFPIA